jgi:hypothetical protein
VKQNGLHPEKIPESDQWFIIEVMKDGKVLREINDLSLHIIIDSLYLSQEIFQVLFIGIVLILNPHILEKDRSGFYV